MRWFCKEMANLKFLRPQQKDETNKKFFRAGVTKLSTAAIKVFYKIRRVGESAGANTESYQALHWKQCSDSQSN